MKTPKYPEVRVEIDLSGPQGNAFYILGIVKKKMAQNGVSVAELAEFHKQATSGDYDNLLEVVHSWVDFQEV